MREWRVFIGSALATGVIATGGMLATAGSQEGRGRVPLSTGKFIEPLGDHIGVGSYPSAVLLSPDSRYVVVSSLGARSKLTVLRASDGTVVSSIEPKALNTRKPGFYLGLAFAADGRTLYAARGSDDIVGVYALDADGKLTDTGKTYPATDAAGLALSPDGKTLWVSSSSGDPKNKLRGTVHAIDLESGTVRPYSVSGYPLGMAAVGQKVYVTSEQAGGLEVLDAATGSVLKHIETGAQTTHLLLAEGGKTLFVSASSSDTISEIDTATDKVVRTILVRPAEARGLPSATPLGLALSTDGKTLYAACGDLNAVAVVDRQRGRLSGFVPAGWYPTAVSVAGDALICVNAKGTGVRNPNGKAVAIAGADRPQYIQNIIEGTAVRLPLKDLQKDLKGLTKTVAQNNRLRPDLLKSVRRALKNPGIEHVIYIVKENRTYDQVLGDLEKGERDPSLCLFPEEVTPNQHALARRFVLLDNFYCSAEVSGDGWNFSTAGMANEYVSRNVPYGYTGKRRTYDYEGTNNAANPLKLGVRDVAEPEGGYLWDEAARKKVSFRNYGMYSDSEENPRATPEEGTPDEKTVPVKAALVNATCESFRVYDTNYPDSEAWLKHGLEPAPKQLKTFGKFGDKARTTAWRREYEAYLKSGDMPKLMLLRLGRDHTAGTAAGNYSPRAMVADNDYAVGQIVETVSHSPLWKKTAIFVLEDDAQNGYDHIDAHRSIVFVISPYIAQGSHDSRFYNTDSVLATMERLLGLDPLCLYDATAPPMTVFGAKPENDAPYTAILPARSVIAELNTPRTFGAAKSAQILNPLVEESEADEELNEILWRSVKGAHSTPPERNYRLSVED